MTKKVVKKTITETVHEEDGSKKTKKKTVTKKKRTRKKRASQPREKGMTAKEREELLLENFVGLQHAMTNLSIKFGSLSDNISKLLEIFEEAAKTYSMGGKPDNADMLNKIDSLLNQNKTIAKGLVLMEAKLREGNSGQPPQRINPVPAPVAPQNRPSMPPSNNRPRPLPSI